jgi:hypothetical protein
MMGTLTLELSDAQLRKLEHLAQKRGISIQALMIAMINDFTAQSEGEDVYDVTQDPIYSIKSHETGAPPTCHNMPTIISTETGSNK